RRRDARPAGSRHYTEPAQPGREAQRHFLASLDRLIERGNQFQTFAPLKTIHQRRTLIDQAIDDMLVIGLMAEAVDVRRIDRKFLNHILVRRKLVDKTPMSDLIYGETCDFHHALFSEDRERA